MAPKKKEIGNYFIKDTSFFSQFSNSQIFTLWESSNTLLELAQKLGFNKEEGLSRVDYEYIESIKTRDVWKNELGGSNRKRDRDRHSDIKKLSAAALTKEMDYKGIETLSHLAAHFMLSSKHGRTTMREKIQALNLDVKN